MGLFDELPTKSSVKKAIKTGQLLVRNEKTTTGVFLHPGMVLELYDLQQTLPKPYKESVEVVYEDDELAVVNKPPGLPTSGNRYRTLENILVGQIPLPADPAYLKWPKPVHRLDSPTSGLVLVAKTIHTRFLLGQAFEDHTVQKTYHALVMGDTPKEGTLRSPVGDKPAETGYQRIGQVRSLKNDYLSLLKLSPKTGRTHQLRIHCARAGFPVYGDQQYAEKTIKNKGLFLAATGLLLDHPVKDRKVNVSIDLPVNFKNRMKNEQKRWEKYFA